MEAGDSSCIESTLLGFTEIAFARNSFETSVFFANVVFDASTEVAITPTSNSATTTIETTIFFLIFHDQVCNCGQGATLRNPWKGVEKQFQVKLDSFQERVIL